MIRQDWCDTCGKYDLTGWVSCVKKQLCPECASPHVIVEPKLLRDFLEHNEDIDKVRDE